MWRRSIPCDIFVDGFHWSVLSIPRQRLSPSVSWARNTAKRSRGGIDDLLSVTVDVWVVHFRLELDLNDISLSTSDPKEGVYTKERRNVKSPLGV